MKTGPKRKNWLLAIYATCFLVFLYVPILLIPLFSLNESMHMRFPLSGFTFQWYAELWGRSELWNALWNSVRVAVLVSVVSTCFGVFAARAIARQRSRDQTALIPFIMSPLVIPGIVLGLALLMLVSRLGVPLSLYTVGLGHLIICLPFAIATLLPRLEGFDTSIEDASVDLGETEWWTFWRVTFPIILPGVIASLLLTFTVSLDEFLLAFLLSGSDQTLPVFIWGQLRFPQRFPSVLALSSVILLASIAIVLVAVRIGRIGLGAQSDRKSFV